MTTLDTHTVTCANCKTDSEQTSIMSTNEFGSPDLDLRPPEMARGTFYYWLQECTDCGYVSRDISEIDAPTSALLGSNQFACIAADTTSSELMKRFLKRAFLDQELENLEAAAHYFLFAAWVADDERAGSAKEHRAKSASLFERVIAGLPAGSEAFAGTSTRLIDIYRRAEEWQKAITVADSLLSADRNETICLDETIKAVVEFGKKQAAEKNAGCFTVEEAMAEQLNDPD
jgi:hypothetical protein